MSIPYFQQYIDLVKEPSVVEALQNSVAGQIDFLGSIPVEKADYAYESGKWTIKQMVQHLCDSERIFNYRALTFAREDHPSIPGYDHDSYGMAPVAHIGYPKLVGELMTIRLSTIALFENFSDDQLARRGTANGIELSVKDIGFVQVGHVTHHLNVLQERYL